MVKNVTEHKRQLGENCRTFFNQLTNQLKNHTSCKKIGNSKRILIKPGNKKTRNINDLQRQ